MTYAKVSGDRRRVSDVSVREENLLLSADAQTSGALPVAESCQERQ
jgi:hypothetical protein